jgi:hypothetical protein
MQRPLSYLVIAGVTIIGIVASAVAAGAASGSVSITKSRGKICMASNGLPDHATGRFPNPGNPHRMRAQFIEVCVPENPVRTARATELRGATGFALNGVLIRPGTADYYDPSSPRGFSRDPASGWNSTAREQAACSASTRTTPMSIIAVSTTTMPIPRACSRAGPRPLSALPPTGLKSTMSVRRARSGYTLKPGNRQGGPGGRHDGTYVRDWQFTGGTGTLDQCNGGKLDGRFVYFVTDSYPYFPHCAWGEVSRDFARP